MTDAEVEPVPCRDCGTPTYPNMAWCQDCDEKHRLRAVLDAARNITDDWCDSFNVTEFGCTCPVHDLIARVRDADAATR